MVASVQTLAGSTIGISAVLPATYDEAGYEALSFTTIGEVVDIPEYGKEYTLVTHNPVGSRRTQKFKGSYDQGSASLPVARDDDDAGQVIVLAALDSDNSYAFAVTAQDGSIDYFDAKVMNFRNTGGGVNTIATRTLDLQIDSEIVTVQAS